MITPKQKRQMVKDDERHFLDNQFLRLGILAILLIALSLIVLAVVTHVLRERAFEESLARARAALADGRHRVAAGHAMDALEINPENVPALELAALLAGVTDSPDHLRLRMQLASMAPDSADAQIRLAEVAADHGALDRARESLDSVPAAARESPAWLAAAAKLDAIGGDVREAIDKLDRAVMLAADDVPYRLRLARLLVAEGDPRANDILAALESGESLPPGFMLDVLRLGAANTGFPEQQRRAWARRASLHPRATEDDHRTLLGLVARSGGDADADVTALLARLRDPATRHRVVLRAVPLGLVDAAGRGLDLVKPEHGGDDPHQHAARAAVLAAKEDWTALLALLKNSDWGELDYLLGAYTALGLRHTQGDFAWKPYWSEAVRQASRSSASLDLMHDTVRNWPSWERQTIDALWTFVRSGNNVPKALEGLYGHYLDLGDAGGLLKVVSAAMERDPDNPELRSEYARLCLLRRIQEERARRLAAEAHLESPDSEFVAITQAFSLSGQGRHSEALGILEALPSRAFHSPGNAAYMAIVLARANRLFDALPYAEIARRGRLLNEEERLLP